MEPDVVSLCQFAQGGYRVLQLSEPRPPTKARTDGQTHNSSVWEIGRRTDNHDGIDVSNATRQQGNMQAE